ncbi:MAG: carbohydrate kinase, partial [Pirellulaceae bacterium]|nr:carbohydrate kinase [Pirellulaceae bacterium]
MTIQKSVIVGLGEILWDLFPDGAKFGGAPANFACSAAGLARDAAEVLVVSAVGNDELGDKAIASLQDHRVDTGAVQRLDNPTGSVAIELDDEGKASYRFADNTAWDNLVWSDDLAGIASRCDA